MNGGIGCGLTRSLPHPSSSPCISTSTLSGTHPWCWQVKLRVYPLSTVPSSSWLPQGACPSTTPRWVQADSLCLPGISEACVDEQNFRILPLRSRITLAYIQRHVKANFRGPRALFGQANTSPQVSAFSQAAAGEPADLGPLGAATGAVHPLYVLGGPAHPNDSSPTHWGGVDFLFLSSQGPHLHSDFHFVRLSFSFLGTENPPPPPGVISFRALFFLSFLPQHLFSSHQVLGTEPGSGGTSRNCHPPGRSRSLVRAKGKGQTMNR